MGKTDGHLYEIPTIQQLRTQYALGQLANNRDPLEVTYDSSQRRNLFADFSVTDERMPRLKKFFAPLQLAIAGILDIESCSLGNSWIRGRPNEYQTSSGSHRHRICCSSNRNRAGQEFFHRTSDATVRLSRL